MTFQKQKESILKFYEDTSDYVGQHKDTYSKLVNKLNETIYHFCNFNFFTTLFF